MRPWIKKVFWLTGGLVWSLTRAVPAVPCLQLAGVVQDYASHQPLAARLYLKTSMGRSEVGSSMAGTGRFTIAVTCPALALIIERPGYRPQMLLLNLPIAAIDDKPVDVIIPLVAVDQLGRDKPYLQTEQTYFEQKNTSLAGTRPQHNIFTINDALTNKLLTARTCFFFTKGGQKRCLDTDADGRFSLDFTQKDIVAMEVTATGYQTYQGNLIVDELDGRQRQHTIRLTRELTLLSVRLNDPAEGGELRDRETGKIAPMKAVPQTPTVVVATDLWPQSYKLTIFDQKRAVLEQRSVSLRPGLNVVQAVARPPAPGILPETPLTTLANADSLPILYFEQGSFTILASSKAILVQTAAYLRQHPSLKVRLSGHTDREGDEQLNRYLAENRAKAVSTFLFAQGVPDERIDIVGYGSRYPLAPSDKEENKARNRRVQMKFILN